MNTETVAHINGVALHAESEAIDERTLRERAITEVLRQEAVRQGLLALDARAQYAEPSEHERGVIEHMVDAAVTAPEPTDAECQRHYEAQKSKLTVGQAVHLRHILFAVTPGVHVTALAQRAEAALLELSQKGAKPGRFAELAAELSNCPSSAQGGDLDWLRPEDCAPELAKALFFQTETQLAVGLHPRLVHSRFGLHIMEVLGHRPGHLPLYQQVSQQIAFRLTQQTRATAMRQYMKLLVGRATVEGLELEGSETPLVQ